jgi:hypothetical protein
MVLQLSLEGGSMLAGICSVHWPGIVSCDTQSSVTSQCRVKDLTKNQSRKLTQHHQEEGGKKHEMCNE